MKHKKIFYLILSNNNCLLLDLKFHLVQLRIGGLTQLKFTQKKKNLRQLENNLGIMGCFHEKIRTSIMS